MANNIKGAFDHPDFSKLKEYDYKAPAGTWTGKLDFLAWGKSSNLFCYFTNIASGQKHVLSVFSSAAGYVPREGGPNFKDEDIGHTYEIRTGKSARSAYMTFLEAKRLG